MSMLASKHRHLPQPSTPLQISFSIRMSGVCFCFLLHKVPGHKRFTKMKVCLGIVLLLFGSGFFLGGGEGRQPEPSRRLTDATE